MNTRNRRFRRNGQRFVIYAQTQRGTSYGRAGRTAARSVVQSRPAACRLERGVRRPVAYSRLGRCPAGRDSGSAARTDSSGGSFGADAPVRSCRARPPPSVARRASSASPERPQAATCRRLPSGSQRSRGSGLQQELRALRHMVIRPGSRAKPPGKTARLPW